MRSWPAGYIHVHTDRDFFVNEMNTGKVLNTGKIIINTGKIIYDGNIRESSDSRGTRPSVHTRSVFRSRKGPGPRALNKSARFCNTRRISPSSAEGLVYNTRSYSYSFMRSCYTS